MSESLEIFHTDQPTNPKVIQEYSGTVLVRIEDIIASVIERFPEQGILALQMGTFKARFLAALEIEGLAVTIKETSGYIPANQVKIVTEIAINELSRLLP